MREKDPRMWCHWGGKNQAHQEENSQRCSVPISVGTIPV
jgi:hypothetical protein